MVKFLLDIVLPSGVYHQIIIILASEPTSHTRYQPKQRQDDKVEHDPCVRIAPIKRRERQRQQRSPYQHGLPPTPACKQRNCGNNESHCGDRPERTVHCGSACSEVPAPIEYRGLVGQLFNHRQLHERGSAQQVNETVQHENDCCDDR